MNMWLVLVEFSLVELSWASSWSVSIAQLYAIARLYIIINNLKATDVP